MNKLFQTITQAPAQVSLTLLILNIILSAFSSLILSWFYIRFGQSLSNRAYLARNFLLISVTTTLIITVVKSSLALSLGLVGALSIVRFRSAIKEPEELAYLFLAIAIGLGFGANQHTVTLTAFITILVLVYFQTSQKHRYTQENLFLTVTFPQRKNSSLDIKTITDKLKDYCKKIDIRRVDSTSKVQEFAFYVEYKNALDIDRSIKALKNLSPSIQITLIDQSGMIV